MAGEKFHGLDELRGYAAIVVMFFHSSEMLGTNWLFPSGFLAVDIFFLMSGFVVAHSYPETIRINGVVFFLKKRLIRFYPLLLLGLLISTVSVVGLFLTGHDVAGVFIELPASLLFIPSPPTTFSFNGVAPLNAPQWSLILELWINVAYAVFLPRLNPKVFLTIIVLSFFVLCCAAYTYGSIAGGSHLYDFWVGAARICLTFPMGVLLYQLRGKISLPTVPTWALGLIVAAAMMTPPDALYGVIFVSIVCPIVVAAAISGRPETIASRFGASSSYCIYIVHFPVLALLSGITHRLSFATASPTICAIVALVLVSPLLDQYYDRPARRWLTGLLLSPKTLTA